MLLVLSAHFGLTERARAQSLDPGKAWVYCRVQIKLSGTWNEYYTSVYQSEWDSTTNERQFGDYMARFLKVDRAAVDPVMCMEISGWSYQQTANARADAIRDDKADGDVIRGVSWPQ